jgi:Cu/Ag efflux protein CusF
MRFLTVLISAAAILTLVVGSVTAQTQAPSVSPPVPGAPPASPETIIKEVEGTVKKVDPAAKSVQVSSGLLGLLGATMSVTDETKISVQGKEGSIADIREGAKVKASYESRDGKNMAKSIEVMAAEENAGSPARPATGVFPGGTPPGTPPLPAPKTQ